MDIKGVEPLVRYQRRQVMNPNALHACREGQESQYNGPCVPDPPDRQFNSFGLVLKSSFSLRAIAQSLNLS